MRIRERYLWAFVKNPKTKNQLKKYLTENFEFDDPYDLTDTLGADNEAVREAVSWILNEGLRTDDLVVSDYQVRQGEDLYKIAIVGVDGAYAVWAEYCGWLEIFESFFEAQRYVKEAFAKWLVKDQ